MQFSTTNTINRPAPAVWSIIREFTGIEKYVPAIAQSSVDGEGVGAFRTCVLQDGAQMQERIVELNDENRTLQYAVVDPSPLPMKNYVSTMKVQNKGNGTCELIWSCTYEPNGAPVEAIEGLLTQVYNSAVPGLEQLLA